MIDAKSDRFVFLSWAALAMVSIGVLQVAAASATGGIAGLLQVGEDHSVRPVIEAELGDIPIAPGLGHDGQLSFAIGLDLRAEWIPEYLEPFESPSYRYRRIGYPALSSAFSLLDGTALLWGMVLVNSGAVGFAAGAVALIARKMEASSFLALAVVLNPGVWQSALLLTSDNLALAALVGAVYAWLSGRLWWAGASTVLAILAKDSSAVVLVAFAGYALFVLQERRLALQFAAGVSLPVLVWLGYVHLALGAGFDSSSNLGVPFLGLIEAARAWPEVSPVENMKTGIALLFLTLEVTAGFRSKSFWKWQVWPWVALAVMSSHLVWDLGNNSLRVFSPMIVLALLGLADRREGGRPTDASHSELTVPGPADPSDGIRRGR